MKHFIAALVTAILVGGALTASAQSPLPANGALVQPAEFIPTKEQKKAIAEAESFLNSIKTMKANFQQVMPMQGAMPGGTVSEGVVYLKRPGQMKWVYTMPSAVEIFLEKNRVIYHDKELDQVTYAPLEHMLASLIAQDNISFTGGNIKIIGVKKDDTGIRITLEQRVSEHTEANVEEVAAPNEGAQAAESTSEETKTEVAGSPQQIAMTFLNPDTDMFLYSMDILDEGGRNTRIEFSDVAYDAPLDDAVFEFKNPRLFNPKKRN